VPEHVLIAPKISVIIPVYNTAPYLRRCLDSVCGQTLRDLEIICIDDASSDTAAEILLDYAHNDARIRLITLDSNKGVSVARNTGIDAATGEYIGFVDSDDYIDLDFYEKLYQAAASEDCAKAALKKIDAETGAEIFSDGKTINDKIREHKAYFYAYFTTAIYKTACLRKYNIKFSENIAHYEDPFFTVNFVLNAKNIIVIDNVFYIYINRNDSATNKEICSKKINYYLYSMAYITSLLNNYCDDKIHYAIVYGYIIKHLHWLCVNNRVNNNNIMPIINAFVKIYDDCKYKEDCFLNFYIALRNAEKDKIIRYEKRKIEQKKEYNRIMITQLKKNIKSKSGQNAV
jgi:glycosyltransferase involved in cell wall biosynthesis